MAAEKKKTEKKLNKTPVKKISTSAKTIKKSSQGKTLLIKVPQGGQVIRTFNLTPSLPVGGKSTNWQLVDSEAKKPVDISDIRVSFSVKSSSTEQYFERAVLIIKMQQNPTENGIWRFVADGVVASSQYGDVNHDIAVEVIDQGMTLITHVHVIGDTKEEVRFGYLASFTDAVSGNVSVYESSDPGIVPGRP